MNNCVPHLINAVLVGRVVLTVHSADVPSLTLSILHHICVHCGAQNMNTSYTFCGRNGSHVSTVVLLAQLQVWNCRFACCNAELFVLKNHAILLFDNVSALGTITIVVSVSQENTLVPVLAPVLS